MEDSKQIQKAGENSQQYQAGTIIINQGVTEERVRAIFSEMIPTALQAYTSDAYVTANQRIERLEDNVWPKLDKVDGLLQAFADPAFQILLRKAQQAAAATEREDDYALLSELLVCHVQKGSDRKNRAGINQAIEIVDQIDNDALCALTVAHAVTNFLPISGDCMEGLQVLDSLFSQLMYQELPVGTAWLDHLDVLGAMRVSMLGSMKSFSEYYAPQLNGYACVGIKMGSDDYTKAVEILGNVQINGNFLVPNECLEGYVRLKIRNEASIDDLAANVGPFRIPLADNQKDAIKQVWKLYSKDSNLQQQSIANFMNLWDGYESLREVRLWWERIPNAFQITRVGQILAHTNAKRCSPNIPDLI
ncbi:MAG: hypothetical protein IKU81_05705 [Oscillibacter sp.]|nr:hypothetical protein [Oscillibacter sp.]